MAEENFEECARLRDKINTVKLEMDSDTDQEPAKFESETESLLRMQEEQFDQARGFSDYSDPKAAGRETHVPTLNTTTRTAQARKKPAKGGRCPCLFEWDTLLIILLAAVLVSFLILDIWAQIVRPYPTAVCG